MQIGITTSTGAYIFTVDIVSDYSSRPTQNADLIKSTSGKTKAFNYGSTFDKWFTEITITGEKLDIYNISLLLKKDINQLGILCQDGEYPFGAGIVYTSEIFCNILNNSRDWDQVTFKTSEIKLKLQALFYGDDLLFEQLKYRDNISAGLPTKLNYQTPIMRVITKNDTPVTSLGDGDYAMINEVDQSGIPISSYDISVSFYQTNEEAAQIEKFVFTQRSTPFILPSLPYLDLFENQATENVMITRFVTSRKRHNDWMLTLNLVTNV